MLTEMSEVPRMIISEAVSEGPESQNLVQAFLGRILMSIVAYARVSTSEQRLVLQTQARTAAGADKIFEDQGVSGTKTSRPGLDAALAYLRDGDVLTVWRLDRLGRSTLHVLALIQELGERGVGFRSLTENVDTTTPAGRMMMQMVGSFAEFERAMIRERTSAGLAQARAEGRVGGAGIKRRALPRADRIGCTGHPKSLVAADFLDLFEQTHQQLVVRQMPVRHHPQAA